MPIRYVVMVIALVGVIAVCVKVFTGMSDQRNKLLKDLDETSVAAKPITVSPVPSSIPDSASISPEPSVSPIAVASPSPGL